MIFGYARVSTDGQSLDAQRAQLRQAGCGKIFDEKVSGARSDRARLKALLAGLGEGDLVLVTRLDRLARSTRDLLNILAAIVDKGARISFVGRSLGRQHHTARAPHADRAGRFGGV